MRRADRVIAELAAAQHGVVTRLQLLSAGLSSRMIDHRIQTTALISLHPGVYTLPGLPRSWYQQQSAACLWARGVAGVRAAAHLHQLPGFEQPPVEVVTTATKRPMPRCGVICHHTTRLPRDQIVIAQDLPVTSIERTLLDLCGHISPRRAAIAMDQALHGGKCTLGGLDHCLYQTARRGRDGCAVLRRFLHERLDLTEFPNSGLETVIFELLSRSALPMPDLQRPVYDRAGNFVARPDFLWSKEKLIVEGHSKLWHEGLVARRSDQVRHDRLASLGYRILYVTWADATKHAETTTRLLGAALNGREVRTDVMSPRWNVAESAEKG